MDKDKVADLTAHEMDKIVHMPMEEFKIKVSKREAKAEEIRQEHAEMMEELALLEEKWASIQKEILQSPDLSQVVEQLNTLRTRGT